MCIVSNWVNEAQDLIAVKKYDDLPNSLIPNIDYTSWETGDRFVISVHFLCSMVGIQSWNWCNQGATVQEESCRIQV